MRKLAVFMALLVLVVLFWSLPGYAQETGALGQEGLDLSLERAVEMALKASAGVDKARLAVDRAGEVREATWKAHSHQLIATFIPADGMYVSLPPDKDIWPHALRADRQYWFSRKQYEMARDGVALATRSAYMEVLQAEENLDVRELALRRDTRQVAVTRVLVEAGMLPRIGLAGAQARLAAAQAEVETAGLRRADAYRALNRLLGLDMAVHPVLTDVISFKPLEVQALETEVGRVLSLDHNPLLWMKYEGYELSRYVWSYVTPDTAGRIDIDLAWLDYTEARVQTREAMYELYSRIKNLEAVYHSAMEGAQTAEESLRLARVKHEVGLATQTEVLEAEAALAAGRLSLLELAARHALLKESFAKPWLVPGT